MTIDIAVLVESRRLPVDRIQPQCEQIFPLLITFSQQTIVKYHELNLDLHVAFVDYDKAFDSIERAFILLALRNQGAQISSHSKIYLW